MGGSAEPARPPSGGNGRNRRIHCKQGQRIAKAFHTGGSVFVGQYEHALDGKGRVVLPAPFRASVAERGYVTPLDGCLGMWDEEGFRAMAERWKAELDAGNLSSKHFRRLLAGVKDVKLDAAGRVSLPKEHLEAMGFDAQVVVAGRLDRVEIWPADRFESELEEEDDASFEDAIRTIGF